MVSLITIINQGVIFSLVAIAVFLTSRVIQKDDLSVEGSFGLGGAITAVMIERGMHASLSLLVALIAGALVGACTGVLYTRLRMNHLMAGLVSTTACFSLALALASANKIVSEERTIFSLVPAGPTMEMMMLLFIASIMLLAVMLIMRSDIGLLLRAVGENPSLLVNLCKSSSVYYSFGFILANAITAVAGSLFVQWSGFFSITGNIGVLISGLATLMFAEIFSKRLSFILIIAAVLYQSVFYITLELGVDPIFNNLIKALLMIALMMAASWVSRSKKYA